MLLTRNKYILSAVKRGGKKRCSKSLKKQLVMQCLTNIHFSHLLFKDLNSEMLGLPNSTLCFYGIVPHRCLQSMSLLICSSERMFLKLNTEKLRPGSFCEKQPKHFVERVCQHPPMKWSDILMKPLCSCISFVFLLSSQNWRLTCSPKNVGFIYSFMNLVPDFRGEPGLWIAPYLGL